jgi:hypothetical protein
VAEIAQAAPACPYCESQDLQPRGWRRPNVEGRTRTAIGINCNEDAIRQRVQCRNFNKYFALPPLERIEAKPGRPKVSRSVCACGSLDLRPAGWTPDGRQMVRCNLCNKTFSLQPGMLVQGKPTRYAHYRDVQEHEWRPDAAEEASALLKLFESGECAIEEIRELISVTEAEKSCLAFLASAGMLAESNVQYMIRFRDDVLQRFNNLIDVEAACIPEPKSQTLAEKER